MDKIRRHIIFRGYVQGVGFRYKAYHTAQHYGITGWVRNCGDGSVEMEAEGLRQDLDALLLALKQHSWGEITDTEIQKIPLQGDRSFEIK